MISLSNVLKYSHYSTQTEKRVLEPKVFSPFTSVTNDNDDLDSTLDGEQPESLVDQELLRVQEEAKHIIDQANKEISLLKKNALQEIESWKINEQRLINEESERIFNQARDEGYQHGFDTGLSSGTEEALHRYQDHINHAASIVKQTQSDWERRIEQSEPYLVDLAIEIAKKVIQRELLTDKQTILQIVKETLKLSSELKEVTLAVHPDDYPLIRSRIDELKLLISSQANLVILPDYSIASGGCIIRSSLGTLDARVDTQLEEIKRSLLDVIEGSDLNELETVGKI